MQGIDIVTCAKLLAYEFGDSKHNDYILKICIERLYLLNLLKTQGQPQLQLQTDLHAILISRLLCASPAWNGFTHTADTECIQK